MVALLRNIADDRACGIMHGAAIKLDPGEHVSEGLCIASNCRERLLAMQTGYRPIWIVSALAQFPLLNAVEALSIICDGADDKAVEKVAERWRSLGWRCGTSLQLKEDADAPPRMNAAHARRGMGRFSIIPDLRRAGGKLGTVHSLLLASVEDASEVCHPILTLKPACATVSRPDPRQALLRRHAQ